MSISVQHINKSYNGIPAVKDISFEVNQGELFGLIGPDGAGKTTIFRILTTLLLPDSGTASVAGIPIDDYKSIRNNVGYMPGKFSLYPDLTVGENLTFFATIFGTTIEENYDLVKDIYSQIEPFKNRRAGALSGGMKQKLALSCALIHKPKVLFLDEPTTGVDPVSRKEFWEMLKRLREKNITILVSTAYMDEAGLCDRVALILDGNIMKIETPERIKTDFHHQVFSIRAENNYHLLLQLEKSPYTHSVYPFGENLHYIDTRKNITLSDVRALLNEKTEVEQVGATVEDVFIELSGGLILHK